VNYSKPVFNRYSTQEDGFKPPFTTLGPCAPS
jgi:hypothetical protein